jgi:tetratricopeptide (TPR) repeat protein
MRATVAVAVAAVVLGLGTPLLADGNGGQQQFEAATGLEVRGDYAGAAAALERLGHEQPGDAFAADALFEAAVVAEERLSDPERAHRLYEEVAAKYPSNRLARRARTRSDFLGHSLATGEAPLREYDAIINGGSNSGTGGSTGAGARASAEARTRMERLLTAHPDFALADRALYWLGQAYLDAHDETRANASFVACETRFSAGEWAPRCKKARADVLLGHGRPFAARALYRELAASSDPLARSSGVEGLADSFLWIGRTLGVAVAVAYLLLFFALELRAIRPLRRLATTPTELLYYGPVALLFVVAALTENRLIGAATAILAVGGGLIVWIAASGYEARLERGAMGSVERLRRAATVALAVVGLMFLAVQTTGLTDLVVETLKWGPER